MAFTNTTLSTTPLLETTFISDMRIIVNSNVTVLKSKVEDLINTLQIDLVNKYLGTDLPLGKVFTDTLVVSNQVQLKAGAGVSAAVIAQLSQSGGYSTLDVDNVNFTRVVKATSTSSRAAIRTVVVGGTSGSTDLTYPTSGGAGIPDPGLYVGDTLNPVNAGFYGNVNFAKTAITQSTNANGYRAITLQRPGSDYSYGILSLSRTDPQFIMVDLYEPDGLQDYDKAICLGLHEDFTTPTSRPQIGQSFTVIINNIYDNTSTPVATTNWPQVVNSANTTSGLSVIPGWFKDSTSGAGKYKTGYINNSTWNTWPTSGQAAVGFLGSMTVKTFARFFSESSQSDTANPDILGSCITFTKISESTDFSRYVITGGSNYTIVNA